MALANNSAAASFVIQILRHIYRLSMAGLVFFSFGCTAGKNNSQDAGPTSQALQSYTLSDADNNCSTGTHEFGNLQDLCKGLVSEELNQGCAKTRRMEIFKSKCIDFNGEFIIQNIPPEFVPQNPQFLPDSTIDPQPAALPKDPRSSITSNDPNAQNYFPPSTTNEEVLYRSDTLDNLPTLSLFGKMVSLQNPPRPTSSNEKNWELEFSFILESSPLQMNEIDGFLQKDRVLEITGFNGSPYRTVAKALTPPMSSTQSIFDDELARFSTEGNSVEPENCWLALQSKIDFTPIQNSRTTLFEGQKDYSVAPSNQPHLSTIKIKSFPKSSGTNLESDANRVSCQQWLEQAVEKGFTIELASVPIGNDQNPSRAIDHFILEILPTSHEQQDCNFNFEISEEKRTELLQKMPENCKNSYQKITSH